MYQFDYCVFENLYMYSKLSCKSLTERNVFNWVNQLMLLAISMKFDQNILKLFIQSVVQEKWQICHTFAVKGSTNGNKQIVCIHVIICNLFTKSSVNSRYM